MLLGAVVLYAASGILVQREPYQAHPLGITVGALILSLPLYLILWAVTDGRIPEVDWSSRSPWAVLYLAVFGSLIGFMSYFYIVKTRGATVVSMVTLATPMFALYLGHHFNGEQISVQLVLGSILVLSGLGLYFVSMARGGAPSTESVEASPGLENVLLATSEPTISAEATLLATSSINNEEQRV
jgi:drug/metabolite transporter (DMT)-like permease